MPGKYDSIINLPHHVSATQPQMSMRNRAAQFAPFAALTGYDAAVRETARLTSEREVLDEDLLTELNQKFQLLKEQEKEHPQVTLTYFQPDARKRGGEYITLTGAVRKIDDDTRQVVFLDGTRVPLADIRSVNTEP